ncbi:MAG: DUF3499 domain-containing protein [Actinomycetia bacterium]|nr:DUF3499 domain-containing protein [Actinomycetes bacterium]
MTISCIRCPGRATTLLTYDHASAEAYLDDARGHERAFDGMLLCESHARRFTAPQGWDTIDRRNGGPRSFAGETSA